MRRLLAVVGLATAMHLAPIFAATPAPRPQPAADEFHFVVLGDAQFDDPAAFNRMIDDVVHLNPAFVVQVGDMIEGYAGAGQAESEWQRFRRQIAPLGEIPFVPVPGNHDLYDAERRSSDELVALYERLWGPTYHSFDYRNARFVVLNSDAPGHEREIGGAQWQWLESTLERGDPEHVFVFMHRPPTSLANADALHQLLRAHAVRYVFYGHYHHYHYRERNGIRYVMTNAAADMGVAIPEVGGLRGLLLVTVRDDDARFAVLPADTIRAPDSADPDDNQALFDLTRKLLPQEVALEAAGPGHWRLRLPLVNVSDRELSVYLSCSSADGRWQFEPAAIPAVRLAPAAQRELSLAARYATTGLPETTPVCTAEVPFQTRFGDWVRLERKVTAVLSPR